MPESVLCEFTVFSRYLQVEAKNLGSSDFLRRQAYIHVQAKVKDNVFTFIIVVLYCYPAFGGRLCGGLQKVVPFSQTQANSVGWKGTY